MTGKKGKAKPKLRTEDEIRERIKYWEAMGTDPQLAVLCDAAGCLAELEWMLNEEADQDG